MEYTDKEKEILSLIKKTNFKNLSKSDFISYASKLNELRPEVANQVIEQFPELVKLIQSTTKEYEETISDIIESDDKSILQAYDIFEKELNINAEARREFFEFADKVRTDLAKELDKAYISEEYRRTILEHQMEILRMADKKDEEIREKETETVHIVNKKDSEKRAFGRELLIVAGVVIVAAVGVGVAALGGDFDINLPNKKR